MTSRNHATIDNSSCHATTRLPMLTDVGRKREEREEIAPSESSGPLTLTGHRGPPFSHEVGVGWTGDVGL